MRVAEGGAEIVFAPAHVLAQEIQDRTVSSVEVVDAYLAWISRCRG